MAIDDDSYGTMNGVAALVPQHANVAAEFDANTEPSQDVVETWINDLSDVINVILDDYGYDVPATGRLATWLKVFVQQEVAAQIRSLYRRRRRGPSEDEQQEEYRDLLTNIDKVHAYLDERESGRAAMVAAVPFAGGISLSDKQAREDDSDRTKPAFTRDLHENPGLPSFDDSEDDD